MRTGLLSPSPVRALLPLDLLAGAIAAAAAWAGDATTIGWWFLPAWVMAVSATAEYRRRATGGFAIRRLGLAALVLTVSGLIVAEQLGHPLSPVAVVATAAVAALAGATGRLALGSAARRGVRVPGLLRRVVVVCSPASIPTLTRRLATWQPQLDVVAVCLPDTGEFGRVETELPVVTGLDRCTTAVDVAAADAVVVLPDAGLVSGELQRLTWLLERSRTPLCVAAGLYDVATGRTAIAGSRGALLVQLDHARLSGVSRTVKDLMERMLAVLALLVAAPLLSVLAITIRLDSTGPAIFRQLRVGRNGTVFTMYKLRTMACDAEARRGELTLTNEGAGPLFKVRADPRVTAVGRWLRRASLDELPQLWNVVTGSMSLVGPRPALPEEVEVYPEVARRRLATKPGITGLWQVSGRSDLDWEESVRLDLFYVDNWSPGLDLQILVRTFRAVVSHRGAY